MHCRNCGKELSAGAVACIGCGLPPLAGERHCQACGAETDARAIICIKCGVQLAQGAQSTSISTGEKSKVVAGLLGIFLGWLGIHRFYLGFTNIAAIQLVLGLLGFVTFGVTSLVSGVWGLVDGIMILTGSIKQDASGKALRA